MLKRSPAIVSFDNLNETVEDSIQSEESSDCDFFVFSNRIPTPHLDDSQISDLNNSMKNSNSNEFNKINEFNNFNNLNEFNEQYNEFYNYSNEFTDIHCNEHYDEIDTSQFYDYSLNSHQKQNSQFINHFDYSIENEYDQLNSQQNTMNESYEFAFAF